MDLNDAGMGEILDAVRQLQDGDRVGARRRLERLWHRWSRSPAPSQQCVIAHFLADLETDPELELRWDLLSLEAATVPDGTGRRRARNDMLKRFLPSIHLNVGDAYRRTGDFPHALRHAELGSACSDVLEPGGYRDAVLAALARLRERTLDTSPGGMTDSA